MSAFTPHGNDMFGASANKAHASRLGDTFLIPPFSVLNAREGWWQERKRAWLALGIQSELGRGVNLSAMEGAIERREAIGRENRVPEDPWVDVAEDDGQLDIEEWLGGAK